MEDLWKSSRRQPGRLVGAQYGNPGLMTAHDVAAALLALATIALIIVRPWRIQEWIWAVAGAGMAILTGLISVPSALLSIGHGWNVYLFLAGILLFAEVARQHGVFHALAGIALRAARGSQFRLFTLFFAAGVLITAFLSNDTTAVVLTIAIVAALFDTDVSAIPYVCACAFVANAASFILPISNPTNLLVFDGHIPLLADWIVRFGIPSVVAIALTYGSLLWLFRKTLREPFVLVNEKQVLSNAGRAAAVMLGVSVLGLLAANVFGFSIGVTAAICGTLTLAVVTCVDRRTFTETIRHVAWGIIPLVAGLFVIVGMLNGAGLLTSAHALFQRIATLPPHEATLTTAAIITAASNIFNNLPVALFSSYILQANTLPRSITDATLIAVDLGPNLSVTGSLATLLWLIIIRQARIKVTPWHFFCFGLVVCLPALTLVVSSIR